ncbi:uncharacterized protein LOC111075970 [Drosophila obscura]|uniref:uncharacterized protein LOC111075970 n=1 Tax=Drosophila obscura TaxID=7282 RepID=UPI000BA0E3CA|nr:uncharacterized protein LOC111075970 [Drosophila obscura]
MTPRRRPLTRSQPRGSDCFRCRVCRGVHALRKCQRFLTLSAEKRLRAVIINKYCHNCLAHQHSGSSCRSGDTCRVCGKNHHTLLHLEGSQRTPRPKARSTVPKASSPTARSRSRSAAPPTTLTSLLQSRSTSVLPTAVVVIDTGLKTFEVGALIDPCSPVSRINASLATAFGLSVTRVGAEGACTTFILSKVKSDVRLEVVLTVEPQLQIRTPTRPLGDHVKEHFANMDLADAQFHRPCTISLVLGADVYPKVILPGVVPSTDGFPVAQNTVFGWTLSGTCNTV